MAMKITNIKRIEIGEYEYMATMTEKDICVFINHNMTSNEEDYLKEEMKNEEYEYIGIIIRYGDNKPCFLFIKKSDEVKE